MKNVSRRALLVSLLPYLTGTLFITATLAGSNAHAVFDWCNPYQPEEYCHVARKLYGLDGVKEVSFITGGSKNPHLSVTINEFSLAQQKQVCRIIWNRHQIADHFSYDSGEAEYHVNREVDCLDRYPELHP